MKIIKYRWLSMILVLLVRCSMVTTAFAGEEKMEFSEIPDFHRKGSVSVALKESETKNVVSGAELTLYLVADAAFHGGDAVFEYTDDFSHCTESLAKVDSENLAEKLSEYAREHKISGTTMVTDQSGKVDYKDIKAGLYLIMQNKESEQYTSLKPFLVSLPMYMDGTYIYDIDASPKVRTVTRKEVQPEPSKPSKPASGTKLPQTGQLNWPIPVMLGCGVFLIILGFILRRTKEKRLYA